MPAPEGQQSLANHMPLAAPTSELVPFLQAQLPQSLGLCGWSFLLPLRPLPRPSKNGPATPGQPLLLSHRSPSSHRPGHSGGEQRDRWMRAHQGPWQYHSSLSGQILSPWALGYLKGPERTRPSPLHAPCSSPSPLPRELQVSAASLAFSAFRLIPGWPCPSCQERSKPV